MRRTLLVAISVLLTASAAQAHEFLIYFEPDSATVPARYSQVIADAACYAQATSYDRVVVTAHSDEAEASTNPGLSRRRAEAVRNLLVGQGVRPEHVSLEGLETQRPAVAGTAGSEALNRRALITHLVGNAAQGGRHPCLEGVYRRAEPPPLSPNTP